MKKRILFVEDNPLLASLYSMMLAGDELWEVSTAGDGMEALALMAQAEFHVVVSDLGLPGMSGIELIEQVKSRCPACCRIIVSGMNDQEEVARSLNSTHQFLAKPFDLKTLKAALNRVGTLDEFLADQALRSLVGQMGTLPSFPTLYIEIMKELSAEEPSIERVAQMISQDPSMTAKLLQIANSAALGLAREVSDPSEAVQHLGLSTIRSLALAVHIFSPFERGRTRGFSMEGLWSHTLRTADLTHRLMQLEGAEPAEAEDGYIAGMLHDAGKLMLASSCPREFERALSLSASRPCALHEAEAEVFGATHAGVAAYLLGLWGLPANIVEAVAFHHAPEKGHTGGFSALAAVHCANALAHQFFDHDGCGFRTAIAPAYLSGLGLQDRLAVWRAACGPESEEPPHSNPARGG